MTESFCQFYAVKPDMHEEFVGILTNKTSFCSSLATDETVTRT